MPTQGKGIYRKPDVKRVTGLSESTIGRLEKSELFPKRKKLTTRLVGWNREEVDAWIDSRDAAN